MFASPLGVDSRAASFLAYYDVCRGIHPCGKEAGVHDVLHPQLGIHSTCYFGTSTYST